MMTNHPLKGSPYGYSGTRIDALGATEYTIVAIAADQSGSVAPFRAEIEGCLAEIVRACRSSPRADNVVLRTLAFDGAVREVHGFKPVLACDPATYHGALTAGGSTALFDAAHNAVASVVAYGEALTKRSLDVNAVVFVVTDGCDCASALVAADVARAVSEAVRSEALQSVLTVLVGVNVRDPDVGRELLRFSTEAGFDHYLQLEHADAATLSRLASFASRSIAMASTALGGGAPIKSLTF